MLLLPFALFLGMTPAPLLALGPLWIIVLGVRMWWPSARVVTLARRSAWVGLVVGAGEMVYGIFALGAAQRSAARGGGLLGAFGLLPLGLGFAIAGLAAVSLALMARGVPSRA